MIREMIMPQLGMGMSEGTVAEWAVKEGERVARDQALVSVETEKVVTELPSPYAGYVNLVAAVGETVPVETLIARIADTLEEYQALVRSPAAAAAQPARAEAALAGSAAPAAHAAAAVAAPPRRIRVSGLARKLARDNGLALAGIEGTGPAGRIVRRDVQALIARATSAATVAVAAAAAASPAGMPPVREKARIPVTGMRRTIAERMIASKNTAAHTHVVFEIDVSKLVAMRETLREREKDIGARISMTAIYARALALACRQVPICNAALIDGQIVLWDEVHVGIGVALPGRNQYDSGLVVPVVRNADAKGLLQIDAEIRALVAKAREGTLAAQDVANATVTLSSSERLGNGGWLVGTPLLSLPQVVAFGPGAPVRRPVVREDGQLAAGHILPCCLTFDHRALDGEPAARLAVKLTDLLGHPELMLL